MNKRVKKSKPPKTALGSFGFKSDIFSTLPLRQEQLAFFIGHQEEVDRLKDGIFSHENCALVGEPGSGKSSLMERVRAEMKRDCQVVSVGVPVADGAYFLRELLQQLLVSLNRKLLKRVNFRSLGMELRREGDRLSKSKLKTMVMPLLQGYSKPLVIFVDDLEKVKADVERHLNRTDATMVLLGEMKEVLELENVSFVLSLQKEFYGHVERMMASSGETTLLGLIKNIIEIKPLSDSECRRLLKERMTSESAWKDSEEVFAESAIRFAISRCEGNPRKLLFFLSEAIYNAYRRKAKTVSFEDLFAFLNRFYRLDDTHQKLLEYLSEHDAVSYDDAGITKALPVDGKSIARRLESLLAKGYLETTFDTVKARKRYSLKGRKAALESPGPAEGSARKRRTKKGAIRYEIG